ncbi:MAG: UPF0175 family protein [Nitrospirae bacterium]|nr:UPF0175 family protein [Nitrospirota bacterium]
MSTKTFSIDLPDTVDREIDVLYIKESVAVTLYHAGKISGKQACAILGKTRREFEDLLPKFGYSVLSEREENTVEISGVFENPYGGQPSKWALLSKEIDEGDNPFTGLGRQVLSDIKEFRENFTFKHDK